MALNDYFVTIPGGTFLMGENDDDKFANDTERPRHEVTLAAFELGRTPVTVAQFREFKANHEPDSPPDWPVTGVSWNDAVAFCSWSGNGARLPSEAEWEYAARAGTRSVYPWGTTIESSLANFYYDEHGRKVGPGSRTPCGSYPPNPWGLHDMLGNACEWVADSWHPSYVGAPANGDAWVTDSHANRVLRGGAWDYLPRLLRVSWRDHLPESTRRDNVGFRVARSLS